MTVAIATRGYYGGTGTSLPVAGASATSSTSTWTAVRRQMAVTIDALTPSSLSSYRYRVAEIEASDFREWAADNPQDAFRVYEIEMLSDDFDGLQNHQIELRVVEAELVMAYPHAWGWYQTKDQTKTWNERTLRAIANEDRNLLDKAIGLRGGSNYVAAQRRCEFGPIEFEELEAVTIMTIPMEVQFFHSSS